MKHFCRIRKRHIILLAFFLPFMMSAVLAQEPASGKYGTSPASITGAIKINPTTVEVILSDRQRMTFDFYGENIFRLFQDNSGGIVRPPEARPAAEILVTTPRKSPGTVTLSDRDGQIRISTARISICLDKATGLFKVVRLEDGRTVIEEAAPLEFGEKECSLRLKAGKDEYFYGGGVQNGRFSHKGQSINIENENSWTDGGVASPTPFYWSTGGYGMMWYTFGKGRYDFGASEPGQVILSHHTDRVDVFLMVDDSPEALLNDFYQLTGHPVLLPKFGFYEGHLNAYNRDYWKEDAKGILFEDGKRYKESQKDKSGIKESLNGEKGNYPFSARAVIDRYAAHDLPLGWILPNDGYGAGYGQAETLDGNIANLKSFGGYARSHGVEIGLWTQSDLHPKAGVSALLQRDIVKEIRDAGVRVLKTDVAWVGAGYSFGLNGVADVSHLMPYYGNGSRPFIISLDGWAGTQRHATVWSGDQTGGKWEYIRFHIPTYIGSGLSGQPNITSDMDGIFGGRNAVINTRDFQWKTFTPMQLNMDGWGANPKYPHSLGEPATSINRWYLKMKSELLPYSYSIAREAVDGLPIMRAMFLEQANPYTLGTATRYQYMYGPYLLVAPIYRETATDGDGNDIRNGIYLPEGRWFDWMSGEMYEGNRILNNFDSPLWKLPVFIKAGAIIPLNRPNNNVKGIDNGERIYAVYPYGKSSFRHYDDDGVTEAYRNGGSATTLIESALDGKGRLELCIRPVEGEFEGMTREKRTEFRIATFQAPRKVSARIGGRKVRLAGVSSLEEFSGASNAYFYEEAPELNRFATPGSEFAGRSIKGAPRLLVKLEKADIAQEIRLSIEGCNNTPADHLRRSRGALKTPVLRLADADILPYSLRPGWDKVENADFYEIEFQGMLYTSIRETGLVFEDLEAETEYSFRLRAANADGYSDWSSLKASTKDDPLEFAIRDLSAENSAADQGGQDISRLVNFNGKDLWHTRYGVKAVPFDICIDLNTINRLDRFDYLPRTDAGNGTFTAGKVYYSMDAENWTEAGGFSWKRDAAVKSFSFTDGPTARYIRISVTEAVGNYGSGREIHVFKVPGSTSYRPGDINNDRLLDMNDITSYMNYTGLRQGDADFEGYVSNGDINRNGLIDAYDISVVATRLRGGADRRTAGRAEGTVSLKADRQSYARGETVEIRVEGKGLRHVNAISLAIPYDQEEYEFLGVEPLMMQEMENMTNDRLHTDGTKALYPTFVNIGNKSVLSGDGTLFILKFKAKQQVKFNLKAQDGFLVDKKLHSCRF